MSSPDQRLAYYQETINAERTWVPQFFVRRLIERRQILILDNMLGEYGAPSDTEYGWISNLLPEVREWMASIDLNFIKSQLRLFYTQQRYQTPKPIIVKGEDYAFDLFRTFAHLGGENGLIVRYVTDKKLDDSTKQYRVNQVVEAMSMVILRGVSHDFIFDYLNAANGISDSLSRLKDQADSERRELAEFAIIVVNTVSNRPTMQ